MFPCSTTLKIGKDHEATTNIIWLPDGVTAWIALASPAADDVELHSTYIQLSEKPGERYVDPRTSGLRAIVACGTDENNRVYFLGPFGLTKMNADVDRLSNIKAERLYRHVFGTPIDVTVKYPFAFISDYSSHIILALNTDSEEFSWSLLPDMPALLFPAGIEHVDLKDGLTALFVADTLNHIVGRLNLDLSTMQAERPKDVLRMRWTAVFGVPKTELADVDQALKSMSSVTVNRAPPENVESNVSCVLLRPPADTLWHRILYFECPRTGYCPGGTDAQMFECAVSSFALAEQATRAEQCACYQCCRLCVHAGPVSGNLNNKHRVEFTRY
eukprot:XP_028334353.1 uncharacterized protein LOC114484144 [Physeter catodon]